MSCRRPHSVCITGAGAFSTASGGLAETLQTVCRPSPGSGHARDFSISDDSTSVPSAWRLARMVARQAWKSAGGTAGNFSSVAVIVGSSRPASWEQVGKRCSKPGRLVAQAGGALAGSLARELGLQGPAFVVSMACTSSALAISTAADMVASGVCDAALAGGVDEGRQPGVRDQFEENGICGPEGNTSCRPFDPTSSGIRLADGAGFLVLERAGLRERKALAMLRGWSLGSDARDRCGRRCGETLLPRCMAAALDMAGIGRDELCLVHAHGNGNPKSDRSELAGLRTVFAGLPDSPPLLATKGLTGHCLGATTAIECALSIELLRGHASPDSSFLHGILSPAVPQDFSKHCRERQEMTVAVNATGLWGGSASLVISVGENGRKFPSV